MKLIHSMMLLNKHKQIWLWPSCNNHPKTLSFRASNDKDSAFMDTNKESLVEAEVEVITLGSLFTNSPETASISTESDRSAVETIVREARSDRLFFEPDSTSSILETQCTSDISGGGGPYKESVAVVMESENPYVDFRESMDEMVEIHGLKDWDCLQELLEWYLKMNEESNHEFIVGAFFDLLAGKCRHGGSGGRDGGGGSGGGLFLDHSIASLSLGSSTYSSPSGN